MSEPFLKQIEMEAYKGIKRKEINEDFPSEQIVCGGKQDGTNSKTSRIVYTLLQHVRKFAWFQSFVNWFTWV